MVEEFILNIFEILFNFFLGMNFVLVMVLFVFKFVIIDVLKFLDNVLF